MDYKQLVTNAEGEPLGVEYVYDDPPEPDNYYTYDDYDPDDGVSLEEEASMEPVYPGPFVVTYDDGHLTVKTEREISRMYDMADCDYMDGVTGVYSLNENGKLVEVTFGEQVRDEGFPEETGIFYSYTPIYAGTRRVGTIAHSDH